MAWFLGLCKILRKFLKVWYVWRFRYSIKNGTHPQILILNKKNSQIQWKVIPVAIIQMSEVEIKKPSSSSVNMHIQICIKRTLFFYINHKCHMVNHLLWIWHLLLSRNFNFSFKKIEKQVWNGINTIHSIQ